MSVTVRDLRTFKERGERFVMLTAYDYPTARILDEAGVPALLVGDSLANNILGYENTLAVTMDGMLYHSRAVPRQGKSGEHDRRLPDQAQALEKSGFFSLVLEGIPAPLAAPITNSPSVPTIG